jgi:hypothetical protein
MAKSKQYVTYERGRTPTGGSVVAKKAKLSFVAPRTFVFAYSTRASSNSILANLRKGLKRRGGHIHGLYIFEKNWLFTQADHEFDDPFTLRTSATLADFCAWLLEGIDSMQLGLVDLSPYLQRTPRT